jgi:hypothetical protein
MGAKILLLEAYAGREDMRKWGYELFCRPGCQDPARHQHRREPEVLDAADDIAARELPHRIG